MNERLTKLTKQMQDAMAEINAIFPVLSVTIEPNSMRVLLRNEEDIVNCFGGYVRVPFANSDYYSSEVYTTLNGVKFNTYSEIKVPEGVSKVVVANPPEREAV